MNSFVCSFLFLSYSDLFIWYNFIFICKGLVGNYFFNYKKKIERELFFINDDFILLKIYFICYFSIFFDF